MLLESFFIRDMLKPFDELQSEVLHLLPFVCVAGKDGIGCLNTIFNILFK